MPLLDMGMISAMAETTPSLVAEASPLVQNHKDGTWATYYLYLGLGYL